MGVKSPPASKRSRGMDSGLNTDVASEKCVALFQGCHFVFLQPGHMQRMKERIRQFGGAVHSSVTPEITHVVSKPGASAQQIAEKLRGSAVDRAPAVDSASQHSSALPRLPPGAHVVTPDFIAHSILQQRRQPEASFLPASLQPAHPSAEHPLQEDPAVQLPTSPTGEKPKGKGSQIPVFVPTPQQQPTLVDSSHDAHAGTPHQQVAQLGQHPAAARGEAGGGVGAAPASAPEGSKAGNGAEGSADRGVGNGVGSGEGGDSRGEAEGGCEVERQGAEFVCVKGRLLRFTGGDTGLPWGAYGVWEEPWEEGAARETVEKLKNFWYQTGARPLHTPSQAPSQGGGPAGGGASNGVCSHAACAERPFCVVERLAEVKQVYVEGRDQFRIKAIERAVQQLVQHPHPLDTDGDVEAVALGTKSAEKVKEILRKGVSSRVVAAEADEERRVAALFMQVWGVGPSTAARWYAAGCRTLQDLQDRTDLTEQQKVGLKYFQDILQRIPRAESAAAQATVRAATFDLADEWGARDVERCFCQVTGSYIRGKPTSGDVDILICLPPSLTGRDCGAFLTQLLCKLLEGGFLLDEMQPRQPHAASQRRASWMGMCRPPEAPCNRRIDVKVYGAPLAPFAVNYFANSMSFCRATRHWANHAVPQAAARYNPAATGFKLSDAEMVLRHGVAAKHRGRGPRKRGAAGESSVSSGDEGVGGVEGLLGPAVDCACETDIFSALQLAYVPACMRFFHDFA